MKKKIIKTVSYKILWVVIKVFPQKTAAESKETSLIIWQITALDVLTRTMIGNDFIVFIWTQTKKILHDHFFYLHFILSQLTVKKIKFSSTNTLKILVIAGWKT